MQDQLKVIREILQDPSHETMSEGYDLLFRLWIQNADSEDFIQDLVPIAAEDKSLIKELKTRLVARQGKDKITNTFLQLSLERLELEISKHKSDIAEAMNASQLEISETAATFEREKFNFPLESIFSIRILFICLIVSVLFALVSLGTTGEIIGWGVGILGIAGILWGLVEKMNAKLAGDSTTDAPPPEVKKNKGKGK